MSLRSGSDGRLPKVDLALDGVVRLVGAASTGEVLKVGLCKEYG